MKANDVRTTYLDYFKQQGHTLVPSSSVVPHGDRTLLFTNAGMNQFKDIFTGKQRRPFPRATTAQKCIRAGGKHNDLDNVGYTARHLTFFEMLGNFSFGDYFKTEAIAFAWELVTKRFAVPVDRLWVTVFREDGEARQIWKKVAGISDDRIVSLGEKDNFWSMGDVGPCGPCSEILFDRGDTYGEADVENGDRFFEIWNLVFMQFEQGADGKRAALPRPSIDTGMGLERMAMLLQDARTVYETDLFLPLLRRVEEISGVPYDPGPEGVVHRVLADHARCLVFAFADGAEPSNEGRGYVLRRILRRAARYGRKILPGEAILHRLADVVVETMGDAYPEVQARGEFITRLIHSEEERFGETLEGGVQRFEDIAAGVKREGGSVVPGADVFTLYDTFGFPVDLVQQMAAEASLTVDMDGFEDLMKRQKERSRGASRFRAADDAGEHLDLESCSETKFLGYEKEESQSVVQLAAERNGLWRVVLDSTPFYAESGGQVGDTGELRGDGLLLEVEDTQRERGRIVHCCRLKKGSPGDVSAGLTLAAAVDAERRCAIRRNHTATHLLHAALRQVVGTHVHQKGSLVEPARLRFDVTHFSAFEPEELARAEEIVWQQILRNLPVETLEMDYEEAVEMGAMALFGEKYGGRVRMVRVGDFSLELCGGTHVSRTGDIGPFHLLGEGSVSAGVRRLEAVTAFEAGQDYRRQKDLIENLSRMLKAPAGSVLERIRKLLEENRELKTRKRSEAGPPEHEAVERERLGTLLFISGRFSEVDGKALREAYDRLKTEKAQTVVVLFATTGSRVQILVGLSSGSRSKGLDAREILAAGAGRVQARGGGRPELVQAGGVGGKEALDAALSDMRAWVADRAAG